MHVYALAGSCHNLVTFNNLMSCVHVKELIVTTEWILWKQEIVVLVHLAGHLRRH